jgi:hypothetical protein
MTQTYPEISIQNAIHPSAWWVGTKGINYHCGRLILAFLPHVDQVPLRLIPIGRGDGVRHDEALVRIEPLRLKRRERHPSILPVAALPDFPGEEKIVLRAKKRPALIVSEGGIEVPRTLSRDKPKWQTSSTLLVAPFYGVDEGEQRSGFADQFLNRIRACEYPQFIADRLPIPGAHESLLKLDHIQPIGKNNDSIELTSFRLSEDAMTVFDCWLKWFLTGKLEKNSLVGLARSTFLREGIA